MRGATVGLAGALLLAGCGGDEATPATTTAPGEDPAATPTSTASTTARDAAAAATGEYGTATVRVGGTTTTFTVIQCLTDTPSAITGDLVALALDGVPPDTPPDLIEPLLGAAGDDDDVLGRLEPVLAIGPVLSVVRMDEGGDLVQVTDGDLQAISTGVDVAKDPTQRFLDIAGGRVTGTSPATGPDGELGDLEVEATCPG